MTSLEQLSQQLSRTTRLQRVTKLEIQGYEHDSAQIGQFCIPWIRHIYLQFHALIPYHHRDFIAESSSVEISDKITALKSRLVDAQQERARRIEYDQLAKSIGKLPDRTKGTECVDCISRPDDAGLGAKAKALTLPRGHGSFHKQIEAKTGR